MKQWLAALAACALLCGTGLAEEKDFAVCVPRDGQIAVPMYEKAGENSEVLMNYFSGLTVDVLDVQNGWAHVSAGAEKTEMTGYMREDELQYGAKAQRTLPRQIVFVYLYPEQRVWNFCGEDRYVIGRGEGEEPVQAIGFKRSERGIWFQIDSVSWQEDDVMMVGDWDEFDSEMEQGYVYCSKNDAGHGRFEQCERMTYRPVQGELTHEEAYERAIEVILSEKYDPRGYFGRLPEELQSEEGLRKMRADVRLTRMNEEIQWVIQFENPENTDENVMIMLTPEGEIRGSMTHGNG